MHAPDAFRRNVRRFSFAEGKLLQIIRKLQPGVFLTAPMETQALNPYIQKPEKTPSISDPLTPAG